MGSTLSGALALLQQQGDVLRQLLAGQRQGAAALEEVRRQQDEQRQQLEAAAGAAAAERAAAALRREVWAQTSPLQARLQVRAWDNRRLDSQRLDTGSGTVSRGWSQASG